MNGRVYDPVLGRFLSADPNIDGGYDSQAYNRYSYVGNNPTNHIDPSGYFKLKDALKIVAVVAIAYFTAGAAISAWGASATTIAGGATVTSAGSAFSGMLVTAGFSAGVTNGIIGGLVGGFAAGFSGSLLNGGSIGDAFKSGVIGGITGAITGGISGKIGDIFGKVGSHGAPGELGRALSHGAAGGLVEEARGGQFRHGFYSGLVASAGGTFVSGVGDSTPAWRAARTAVSAVLGGTASVVGGGKFANGAVTAAFQHLFNHENSRAQTRRVEMIERVQKIDVEYLDLKLGALPKNLVTPWFAKLWNAVSFFNTARQKWSDYQGRDQPPHKEIIVDRVTVAFDLVPADYVRTSSYVMETTEIASFDGRVDPNSKLGLLLEAAGWDISRTVSVRESVSYVEHTYGTQK